MNLDERIDSILEPGWGTELPPLDDNPKEGIKQLIRDVLEYVKPEDWNMEVIRSHRSGGQQVIETAVKTEGSNEYIFEVPLDRHDVIRVKVERKRMEAKIKELGI